MNKELCVKSYWCSCYLKKVWIDPIRIEKNKIGRRYFYYNDNDESQAHIKDFFSNKDLQMFVQSCIDMKKMMYPERKQSKRRNNFEN